MSSQYLSDHERERVDRQHVPKPDRTSLDAEEGKDSDDRHPQDEIVNRERQPRRPREDEDQCGRETHKERNGCLQRERDQLVVPPALRRQLSHQERRVSVGFVLLLDLDPLEVRRHVKAVAEQHNEERTGPRHEQPPDGDPLTAQDKERQDDALDGQEQHGSELRQQRKTQRHPREDIELRAAADQRRAKVVDRDEEERRQRHVRRDERSVGDHVRAARKERKRQHACPSPVNRRAQAIDEVPEQHRLQDHHAARKEQESVVPVGR
jgi:hypothetical protein